MDSGLLLERKEHKLGATIFMYNIYNLGLRKIMKLVTAREQQRKDLLT